MAACQHAEASICLSAEMIVVVGVLRKREIIELANFSVGEVKKEFQTREAAAAVGCRDRLLVKHYASNLMAA